jgi:hypothetical protein
MFMSTAQLGGSATIHPDPGGGGKLRPERKSYQFVPIEGIGDLVESCLEAGMKRVTITPNKGGGTCTMTIES